MGSYQRYIFPLLTRVDAEQAHDRTLAMLAQAQRSSLGRAILRRLVGEIPQQVIKLFGLTFPNVLGVAAGFDKDVLVTSGLGMLGFGHIETGTITPKPQAGNPKPRVFRLKEDRALINRMGFPGRGSDAAVARLRELAQMDRDFIVGVSIGKQKETALAEAAVDYESVLQTVYPYGDYFVVNISSPNTPELRQLQGSGYLADLLRGLVAKKQELAEEYSQERPLLVKIAPDLTWAELDDILQAALDERIDGIIATNTTLRRDGLLSANQSEQGGLSGAPLAQASTAIIGYIAHNTEGRLPIIGVGGVSTADDVKAKIDAGASLVQLYTGLIYRGPGIAGHILRELAK
jgi:dihydroorotate dehydrogenase